MFERICSDNKLQQLHFDNSKSDKYPNYITSWVLPVLAGQEHIIFLIPPRPPQESKMKDVQTGRVFFFTYPKIIFVIMIMDQLHVILIKFILSTYTHADSYT